MNQKSQQKKQNIPAGRKSRGQLVIDITNLLLRQYPSRWPAQDISIQLGANVRTVSRVLKDMTEKGLTENKYHTYSINIEIVKRFYDAKWFVQQETAKSIMLTNKKGNPESGLASTKK